MACGSDSDSSTSAGSGATQVDIDNACVSRCAAQKKCNSATVETTCINGCKNELAAVGTKLRADVVLVTTDCYKTASCDKLPDCSRTATASISPSGAAQTFCDEFTKKVTDCNTIALGFSRDKSACLENWKAYSDATLGAARACLTNSCNDYPACVRTSFGLR
jgi:hypothetical protein